MGHFVHGYWSGPSLRVQRIGYGVLTLGIPLKYLLLFTLYQIQGEGVTFNHFSSSSITNLTL